MKRRHILKTIAAVLALFSVFSLIGCAGKTDSGESEAPDGAISKFAVENEDNTGSDNKDLSSALSRVSNRSATGAAVVDIPEETTTETTVETTVETTAETTTETTAAPTVTPVPTPTPAPASTSETAAATTTATTTTEATYAPEPVYEPEPTYTEAPETEPVVVTEPEPEPAPVAEPEPEPVYETTPETTAYNPPGQVAEADMCWCSRSGTKYHRISDCCGMTDPIYKSVAEAESEGRSPCKNCW